MAPVQTAVLLCLAMVTAFKTVNGIQCSQCSSRELGDACRFDPPSPTPCQPHHTHCLSVYRYSKPDLAGRNIIDRLLSPDRTNSVHSSASRGTLVSVSRDCSPMPVSNRCVSTPPLPPGLVKRLPSRVCYFTCSEDGCNYPFNQNSIFGPV